MSSDRERDRRSLQELAKLANATPAPSSVKFDVGPLSAPLSSSSRKDEDSGLVDLKAFAPAPEPAPVSAPPPSSVAPASAAPASAGPSSVAPVSAAPSSTDAAVVSAAAPSVAPPASAAAPAAAVAVAAKPAEKESGNGKLLVLGGLFAAAAIAAGAFFAMRTPKPEEPVAMNTPVETKAPEKPAAPVVAPTPAPEATEAPAEPAAAAAPKPVAAAAAKGSGAAGAAKVEPKEEKKEEKKVTAADLPASGGAAGDLGAAMRQAAGPGAQTTQEEKPTGPQFAAGSVPQKPSQGAVTGALGAVLGAARACLQPDDPVSRATVTFASAGNVTSVSVSGGAAGKPAEGCIKSALMKAKVSPFAQATYSTPVTIRH